MKHQNISIDSPLRGKFAADWWIPITKGQYWWIAITKGQYCGKRSHIMTASLSDPQRDFYFWNLALKHVFVLLMQLEPLLYYAICVQSYMEGE